MKYKIIGFILILIIVAGVAIYFQRLSYYKKVGNNIEPTRAQTISPLVSLAPTPLATPAVSPLITPPNSPEPAGISPSPKTEKTLRVDVNETAAGLYESRAQKGTLVHFTISVVAESKTLEFRSGSLSTGQISPGTSKTIDFFANENMTFVPYLVSTGQPGPYTIKILVYP